MVDCRTVLVGAPPAPSCGDRGRTREPHPRARPGLRRGFAAAEPPCRRPARPGALPALRLPRPRPRRRRRPAHADPRRGPAPRRPPGRGPDRPPVNVSRGPGREAFKLLRAEGLVEEEPRRGTFVVTLSSVDVREIYDVRAALEGRAAQLDRPRRTTRMLDELEDPRRDRRGRSRPRRRGRGRPARDLASTRRSAGSVGQPAPAHEVFQRHVPPLQTLIKLDEHLHRSMSEIAAQHEPILGGPAGGDAERAARACEAHCDDARDLVADYIDRSPRAEMTPPAVARPAARPGPAGCGPPVAPDAARPARRAAVHLAVAHRLRGVLPLPGARRRSTTASRTSRSSIAPHWVGLDNYARCSPTRCSGSRSATPLPRGHRRAPRGPRGARRSRCS